MMQLTFTALSAMLPVDFDKKETWQIDEIRASVSQGDWKLVCLHDLSQKNKSYTSQNKFSNNHVIPFIIALF